MNPYTSAPDAWPYKQGLGFRSPNMKVAAELTSEPSTARSEPGNGLGLRA